MAVYPRGIVSCTLCNTIFSHRTDAGHLVLIEFFQQELTWIGQSLTFGHGFMTFYFIVILHET